MGVRRLIIHGGMHKTGSSFVQNTLYENSDELASAGVIYPSTGLHHLSPRAGIRHLGIRMSVVQEGSGSFVLDKLRAELSATDAEVAVISYEGLVAPDVDLTVLHNGLAEFDPIVLLYLRHPIDYLESKYREWVRLNNFSGEIDRFALDQAGYLDYAGLVSKVVSVFGRDRTDVRAIELVPEPRRLPYDVLAAGGVDVGSIDLTPSTTLNLRAPNAYTLTKLMANKLYFTGELDARRLVRGHAYDYGGTGSRLAGDHLVAELAGAPHKAYVEVLDNFGQNVRAVSSTWAQRPLDDLFADASTRAEVVEHLRSLHRTHTAERRKRVASRRGSLAELASLRDQLELAKADATQERQRRVAVEHQLGRTWSFRMRARVSRIARGVTRRRHH